MPKTEKIKDAENGVYVSCGNVFADLGFPNPEIHLLKATITVRMEQIIKARKLRSRDVAKILSIDPAEVSHVRRGRFRSYSLERMCKFLLALGDDIDIALQPKVKTREKGEIICRIPPSAGGALAKPAPKRKTKTAAKTAAKTKKRAAPKRKAA